MAENRSLSALFFQKQVGKKHPGPEKSFFKIRIKKASVKLGEINPAEIIAKPKIDRMFQDERFSDYILRLFRFTGLLNWLDIQGAWTFVLFPRTAAGRYYTLNSGSHEAAFSTLPENMKKPWHMILMDKFFLDFDEVKDWVYARHGQIVGDVYKSAPPRSASLTFGGSFEDVMDFLELDGVRRALIAY